jgi:uncharacterized hydrophobic protein (TIGR00271 family)
MYKLTAISPPEKTEGVVRLLRDEPDVSNVLDMPAKSGDAHKDIVTALVRREGIDIVLERLRTIRKWESGELSFIEVDYAARRDLERLDFDEDQDEGEDIIGWEIILEKAHAESRLTWWYLIFMGCAGLIAAVGLISNLPVLILGAMSLSPDLAPTNAIAVTLTAGAWHRLLRSIRTLVLGLVVALAVAFVSTLILELTGIHDGILKIDEDLTNFVTVVNSATIIIALTAGLAAMTAFVTSQATTAVGVAISVTTIPAAAYAGVAIASRSLRDGGAAIVVLVVNILFLTLAQVLTLMIIRAWRARRHQRQASRT